MKRTLSPALLPRLMLGLGGIGLVLQVWMYGTGIDDRGLLVNWHPAWILLVLLTAAAMVLLFLHCREDKAQGTYHQNFPASLAGFLGSIAEAFGIFLLSMTGLMDHPDTLNSVTGFLGVLCFPALVMAGYARWKGKRPSFLLHALVCMFFALRLFCQYRNWSSDPQLQNYCFQMLAGICLMMVAYQRAAFNLNIGSRKAYRFFSLAAVFFCCLSLMAPESKLFYLTAGVGAYTDLCVPVLPEQESPEA